MRSTNYYRIMPGPKSIYFEECYKDNFIGTDFDIHIDLSNKFPDNLRDFNKEFIPIWLENNPDKESKVSAGLACGMLWTVSYGMKQSDVVLCPDGSGNYIVGAVVGDYTFKPDSVLPHRRPVKWYSNVIVKSSMSKALQNSAGSIGTVSNITKYAAELGELISGNTPPSIVATDESIEDPSTFALEKHLEDFLVQNWGQTELGRDYDIFKENGELIGQQYPSDTGPIDILAINKDKKSLLVIELKRGRASDGVVGQIQRYMGYVKEELAEDGQEVYGAIIALEDDLRIQRALSVTKNISFYTYRVEFSLKEIRKYN